jgi:hypothetical protein
MHYVVEPGTFRVIVGPNSSGKTQMLKDLQARLLGQSRKLVVCEKIDLERPPALDPLIEGLCSMRQIRKKIDEHNRPIIETLMPGWGHLAGSWTLQFSDVQNFFNQAGPRPNQTDRFLEHFGRFLSSLFLDRRLVVTNAVDASLRKQGPATKPGACLDKGAGSSLKRRSGLRKGDMARQHACQQALPPGQ